MLNGKNLVFSDLIRFAERNSSFKFIKNLIYWRKAKEIVIDSSFYLKYFCIVI